MFRFSIRELMLLTLVVALAVAAGLTQLDRQRLGKENGRLQRELKHMQDNFGEIPFFDIEEVPATTLAPSRPYGPPVFAPNSLAPVTTPPRGTLPPSSFGNSPSTNPPSFGD